MSETNSAEDFEAALEAATKLAVQAAVTPFQEKVAQLEAQLADGETEARLQKIQADADQALAELQTKLDEAEVRAGASAQALADLEAKIQTAADEAAQADAVEARKEDRLAAVAEFNFTEDHINASIEHWAEMDDQVFADLCEGWKQVAATVQSQELAPAARASALSTTRTTASVTADPRDRLRQLATLGKSVDLGNL